MKMIPMLVIVAAIAGCGQLKQEQKSIEHSDAAMNTATRQMLVVPGNEIPDHPNYTVLGAVQGYCERTPRGDEQVIAGDSMKQAAYRQYGPHVDAIVNATAWFIEDGNNSVVYEPNTPQGHFECGGTAVSFQSR